ncbi:VOC family protein [Allobranchiibius huperziae]|uniref:VOC domain-containing protein n=1 Tax=Allobranchiibius huperziae TaxID=1874116 RepID=A0A853DAZ2_9MICO|nr:VOC family protein [Allobranchiibius huperziae]NYJ73159.1 hypothetical protein [Allobranchiibius huperziae]
MPVRDVNWPVGSPCWAECSFEPEHRGMTHARDFYEKLFGWRTEEGVSGSGGAGSAAYVTCFKDERAAAGLSPMLAEGERPSWLTYLATDDIEEAAQAVQRAGGIVHVPPADAGDLGRLAFCTDPTGAYFALWQAGTHKGFGIVAEPDAVAWHTLLTRDLAGAKAFYGEVFGYTFEDRAPDLSIAKLPGGAEVAGFHQADQLADDVPANWLVHFAVSDRDSSAQIAQSLGAQVLMTSHSPMGPEALLQGKHGEVFTVVQVTD